MNLKNSWPVFFCAAVLLSAPCFAKDDTPTGEKLLAESVKALGGETKFRRLESIQYDFMETRQTPSGPSSVSGHHYFKFGDSTVRQAGATPSGDGFRARVETSSPEGQTLTILNANGIRHWDNGREVKDGPLLGSIREDILTKAFWLMAPFRVAQSSPTLNYTGLGYIEGKLDRRVQAVIAAPSYPLPSAINFTLFIDTSTFQLDGAALPAADGKTTTLLLDRYVGTSTIALPSRQLLMDANHNTLNQFTLMRPETNVYIDEALFDSAQPKGLPAKQATPPAAPKFQ